MVYINPTTKITPEQLKVIQDQYPDTTDKGVLSNLLEDKTGLGTLSGVTLAASLAYLAAKNKENMNISKAIRKRIPIVRNATSPVGALIAGVGTGVLGKYLWDKYNKPDDYYDGGN